MQLRQASAAATAVLSVVFLLLSNFADAHDTTVMQVQIIASTEAAGAAPAPSRSNLTDVMAAHGCKVFADTLLSSPAYQTYDGNVEGGLTVFCPSDDAMRGFLPKFKNLTADGKQSLLEFHGVPVYNSLPMLKSSNGDMNTLATDGASTFDFTVQNDGPDVTVRTKLVTAKITATVVDKQPLAVFKIDKVLMPEELFKPAATPTPAPAPAPEADASPPKPSKKKKKGKSAPAPADSPADSPNEDPADATADNNGSIRFHCGRFAIVALSFWFALFML